MKIVFLEEATVGRVPSIDMIATLGEYVAYDYTAAADVVARASGAKVVIVNKVLMTAEVMRALPSLKLICVAATGMNNIDLEAASRLGIEVCNVAGYSTASVTQTTFSLLFGLISRIPYFDNYVKSGAYSASRSFSLVDPVFCELKDKTYGIIGFGNIGRSVALVAAAFGANIIYYSTSGNNSADGFRRVELDELLKTSDIISIHAPLNKATDNLIGYNELKRMKRNALIINVARGGIVNEEALARAIDEGLIAGAGVDVFTREPIMQDNPLMRVKKKERLLLTPHIAWASYEARVRLMELVYQNILNYENSTRADKS